MARLRFLAFLTTFFDQLVEVEHWEIDGPQKALYLLNWEKLKLDN